MSEGAPQEVVAKRVAQCREKVSRKLELLRDGTLREARRLRQYAFDARDKAEVLRRNAVDHAGSADFYREAEKCDALAVVSEEQAQQYDVQTAIYTELLVALVLVPQRLLLYWAAPTQKKEEHAL